MNGKIGLIVIISLFFTSLAAALPDDLFSDAGQAESIGELSSKIESYLPNMSQADAAELAEVIQLIKQLDQEIYLTNQLIGLREGGAKAGEAEAISPAEEPVIVESPEEPTPKEIVVAKEVSEDAEVNLPREEKSLLTELEKKKIPERPQYRPTTATSPPKINVYSSKELEKGKSSVAIEMGQTIIVLAPGFRRFMATDANILETAKEDNERISITAVGLGKTFLHIWDSEGRRTVKVTVVQKGYESFAEAKKRAIQAAQMESFKVRYSFDSYHLNSQSINPSRAFHFTEWFNRLNITGETPWGMVTSRFQYQGRQEVNETELDRDLSAWDFNLRGDDLEMSVGDTGAKFSDITLPQTSYQGVRFKNPDKKNINFDFVSGARGNRLWGRKVLTFNNANYFSGARAQIEPADFIHFNATALKSLEDEEDVGEYLYAAGMGLNFLNDAIQIEGEAARSKMEETDQHVHAYQIETILRLKDYGLNLTGTYRDIDPNFRTVTGTTLPYIGEFGYYLDANYQPLEYLRLSGQYDVFRYRESFNLTETQRFNRDWRATVDFNMGEKTRLSYAAWNRDHEGFNPPTRGYGELYQVSHILSLPKPFEKPVSLFVRYEPNQYKNLSDTSPNYKERKLTTGLRMSIIKNLSYDIQHRWHYRKMIENGQSGTVKTLSTGLLYSSRILETPFYSSLNFRYEKERDTMENISLTSGESTILGEAEIKYKPSSDFETYFRINYRKVHGVLDHNQNRRETRIYGGGSYLFDTTLRWGTGGSVGGFVFNDINGNGQKEPDEEGIAGINVYAGEYWSATTDKDGRFEMRRIKGNEISAILDTKMLPEGYKPTTSSSQLVKLERGLVSEVYFGVMAASEISGAVFNDVNLNMIFDEGDEGVSGALVRLDDGTIVQTMARGYYRMEEVKARPTTITLDAMTIPSNLIPLAKTTRTVDVKEGKYYEENFPLYALRTVVGAVFIDKNGNNRLDAGEEGVADVEVKVEDNIALTDDMGRFFLKKLKGGMQRIELEVESIPKGYEPAGDHFREVMLLPEGEIKENVDFPLRKK